MSRWYARVARDPEDYTPAFDAIDYFEIQYKEAQDDLVVAGKKVTMVASELPARFDFRYGQLQEIEAILRYLEIREEKILGDKRKHFIEHYNRQLSDRMAEKYAENEEEVVAIRQTRNHVALIRNKYLGLLKGYEYLQYQIGNVTKLRAAGLDDACF